MVIDTDHLVNQIHAEVEGVAETGFPMDVFPERIQKIIYDLVTYENYNLEYTASIILSAYATAIGNTYHVKIKGNWVSSCVMKATPHEILADMIRRNVAVKLLVDKLGLEICNEEESHYTGSLPGLRW